MNRNKMARLEGTRALLLRYPHVATSIRRVWIHGFYGYSADMHVYAVLSRCVNMTTLTVPWTLLRRLDDRQWAQLLRSDKACALESLHVHATCLGDKAVSEPCTYTDLRPWHSPRVSLDKLKRLRLSGNTNAVPFNDDDLCAVSRTATSLRELYIDFVDDISVKGVWFISNYFIVYIRY